MSTRSSRQSLILRNYPRQLRLLWLFPTVAVQTSPKKSDWSKKLFLKTPLPSTFCQTLILRNQQIWSVCTINFETKALNNLISHLQELSIKEQENNKFPTLQRFVLRIRSILYSAICYPLKTLMSGIMRRRRGETIALWWTQVKKDPRAVRRVEKWPQRGRAANAHFSDSNSLLRLQKTNSKSTLDSNFYSLCPSTSFPQYIIQTNEREEKTPAL